MDGFFIKILKCPECGKPLKPEKMVPEAMAWGEAWDSIYESIYLIRRPRYVCMNKKCKSYYNKNPIEHTRYLESLIPGLVVNEHFLTEAIANRKGRKKKKNVEKLKVVFSSEDEGGEGGGKGGGQDAVGAAAGKFSGLPQMPGPGGAGGGAGGGANAGAGGQAGQQGGGQDGQQAGQGNQGGQGGADDQDGRYQGGGNDGAQDAGGDDEEEDAGEEDEGGEEQPQAPAPVPATRRGAAVRRAAAGTKK